MSTGLWKTDTGEVFPYIDDGSGHPRLLTAIEPDPGVVASHAPYASAVEPMPASEVRPFDDFLPSRNPIRDQDGRGACMAFAAVWALCQASQRQHGEFPALSEWFTYSLINGGRDQGATVEAGLRSIRDEGTVADGLVPYATFQRHLIPAAANRAPRHRAELIYRLGSEAEFWTAVMLGRPVAFGCAIDQSFSRLDAEGVPSSTPWSGRGGHAMVAWGGIKILRSGARAYRVVNSWGPSWGVGGCCWMTYEMISRGWGLDAFVVATAAPVAAPAGSHPPTIN